MAGSWSPRHVASSRCVFLKAPVRGESFAEVHAQASSDHRQGEGGEDANPLPRIPTEAAENESAERDEQSGHIYKTLGVAVAKQTIDSLARSR